MTWGLRKGPCFASRLLGWAPSLPGLSLSPAPRLWICGSRTHPWDPGGQGSPEQVRLPLLRKQGRPQAPAATPAGGVLRPGTPSRPKNNRGHLDSSRCPVMGASGGFAGITRLVVRDLRPRLPLSKRQVDWGDQGPHISDPARPGHGRGPWPHSHPGQPCPSLQHPGCPRGSHTLWEDPPRGFQEAGGSNSCRRSGASLDPSEASGSGRGRGLPGHLGGSRSAHTSRVVTGHRAPPTGPCCAPG